MLPYPFAPPQFLQLEVQMERVQQEKEEIQAHLWDSYAKQDKLEDESSSSKHHSKKTEAKSQMEVVKDLIDSDEAVKNSASGDELPIEVSDVMVFEQENWADKASVEVTLQQISFLKLVVSPCTW